MPTPLFQPVYEAAVKVAAADPEICSNDVRAAIRAWADAISSEAWDSIEIPVAVAVQEAARRVAFWDQFFGAGGAELPAFIAWQNENPEPKVAVAQMALLREDVAMCDTGTWYDKTTGLTLNPTRAAAPEVVSFAANYAREQLCARLDVLSPVPTPWQRWYWNGGADAPEWREYARQASLSRRNRATDLFTAGLAVTAPAAPPAAPVISFSYRTDIAGTGALLIRAPRSADAVAEITIRLSDTTDPVYATRRLNRRFVYSIYRIPGTSRGTTTYYASVAEAEAAYNAFRDAANANPNYTDVSASGSRQSFGWSGYVWYTERYIRTASSTTRRTLGTFRLAQLRTTATWDGLFAQTGIQGATFTGTGAIEAFWSNQAGHSEVTRLEIPSGGFTEAVNAEPVFVDYGGSIRVVGARSGLTVADGNRWTFAVRENSEFAVFRERRNLSRTSPVASIELPDRIQEGTSGFVAVYRLDGVDQQVFPLGLPPDPFYTRLTVSPAPGLPPAPPAPVRPVFQLPDSGSFVTSLTTTNSGNYYHQVGAGYQNWIRVLRTGTGAGSIYLYLDRTLFPGQPNRIPLYHASLQIESSSAASGQPWTSRVNIALSGALHLDSYRSVVANTYYLEGSDGRAVAQNLPTGPLPFMRVRWAWVYRAIDPAPPLPAWPS